MTLESISRFIFPYRAFLQEEIEYLKTQLAQKDRRLDQLLSDLVAIKSPRPFIPPPVSTKPLAPVSPKGWDAVRRARQQYILDHPDTEKEDLVYVDVEDIHQEERAV